MNLRIVPVLLVAALGLAACGSDSDSPAANDSLPPVTDGFQHPTGADDVVIQYAEVGGFLPRELAFQQPPRVLVSGDGRVFGPGPQIEIYPGQEHSFFDNDKEWVITTVGRADLFLTSLGFLKGEPTIKDWVSAR